MDSTEEYDQTLPLDMNNTSVNITRFEDRLRLGDTSTMSDPGQASSGKFVAIPDGRMSPASSRSMKDFATQISELKKENFSLKLRIFYMEERMQGQFNDDHEHVFKENIELKVECESLRKELQDKHDLLVRASNAVAALESGPEEFRKAQDLAQKELQQVKDAMQERVQLADKELRAVRDEADALAENVHKLQDYANKLEQDNEELKKDLESANATVEAFAQSSLDDRGDKSQQKNERGTPRDVELLKEDLREKERLIEQLRETLEVKQTMVEALTDEKKFEEESVGKNKETIDYLEGKNKELVDELTKRMQQEERLRSEYMQHISEQQQKLDEFELAARQMSEELEKREEEVQDLSEALKGAEETGKELADNYERLQGEKEEKKTKELLMRDKAISGLTEVVRKRDEEIVRLKEKTIRSESQLEELTNTISTMNNPEGAMGDELQRLADLEEELNQLKEIIKDLELRNQNLASQLGTNDELVRSMDENLKEKDVELQDLLGKYKALLNKQQEDEISKSRAFKEQEDLAHQFEREKKEFADIVNSMKRQFEESTRDVEGKEREKSQEILALQRKLQNVESLLRSKHLQLEEATSLFKKAEDERKAAVNELEDAMGRRDEEQKREAESRNRTSAAKTAEIERLRKEMRERDERIQNLEDNLLQLDRAAHEASDRATASGREATRWKGDSASKDSLIEELMQSLEALGNDVSDSEKKQIVKLTRENAELKRLLKAREAELSFLRNEQAPDDPYIESLKREIARKDKIIADERSKISDDTSSMSLALEALRSEIDDHKRRLNDAKIMIASLTAELESSRQQVLTLHQAGEAKDRVIEDLKAAQRYPAIKSEEGSSTATEGVKDSSQRQQRLKKRKHRGRYDTDHLLQSSSAGSSARRFCSDGNDDEFGSFTSSRDEFGSMPRIKEELKNEIQDLHREIEALKGVRKDKAGSRDLLRKLEQQKEHLKRLAAILTEEQKVYRRQLNVSRSASQLDSEDGGGLPASKREIDRNLRQVENVRNKLCALLLDATRMQDTTSMQADGTLQQSVSSTVFPLDQTSYMEMPYHQACNHSTDEDKESEIAELQAELQKNRRELSDLQASTASEIELLIRQLQEKQKEVKKLAIQLDGADKKGAMKDAEMSALRSEVDKLRALQLKLGRDSSDTDRPSIASGDESDGMGSLSRRELREFIANLKKKLGNSEKLNGLLGDQLESARREKYSDPATVDPNLTEHLSAEVERLKGRLAMAQEELENAQRSPERPSRHSDPKSDRSALRSRLPVPVEVHPKAKEIIATHAKEKQDYAQLKVQCSHLQNKLAATEETVRQQTEKLKKCKAAMVNAGLDVPLSPIKSARSHPNLLLADEIATARSSLPCHARNNSSDTAEARTQTSADDTGYASVSPKSEQKYNSLIQSQAKELSTLRQQLKKARETCKDLRTEYDIVLRYVTTLLNTAEGRADTMLATSVTNELQRCKQLTKRLKEQLSEWTSDGSVTSDSDESSSSIKVSLAQQQASQLLQKSQEIDAKNEKIRQLEERLSNLTGWGRDSQPHFLKFKGQKVLPENLGYLTPTSSHHSIFTNGDEELTAPPMRPTVSQATEYVPLPDRRSPRPRDDATFKYSPRLNKNLPMYQRTIAVTEYLPPNAADEGRFDDLRGRHRLPTTGDAESCTASYSGFWGSTSSPRKQQEFTSSFKHDPILRPKDDTDEVIGLRRQLEDSRSLNDSLKEELDLTTEALNQAKRLSNLSQSSRNPADILDEHLGEIRALRQHLESSIETNDKLREQLEKKLKQAGGGRQSFGSAEHVSANIYLPVDPSDNRKYEDRLESLRQDLARANEEVAKLQNQIKAEIGMKNNFAAASRELEQLRMRLVESSTQTEMLGNYVDGLNRTIELKETEIETLREQLERVEGDLKLAKDENEVKNLETEALRNTTNAATDHSNKMRNHINELNDELDESHHLVRSLKSELALYEKMHKSKGLSDAAPSRGWNFDVAEFLSEIKSLRVQLERSIEANAALRKQLQEQLRYSKESGNEAAVTSPGRMTTINIHHLPADSACRDGEEFVEKRSGVKRKLKMARDEKPSSLLMTPPPSASSCGDEHSLSGFDFAPLPMQGSPPATAKRPPPEKMQNWPYYNLHGPYIMGKMVDFNELKQIVMDGRLLVRNMELKSTGKVSRSSLSPSRSQQRSKRTSKELEESIHLLRRMLEDSGRLLKLFWPASVPPPPITLPLSGEAVGQACQKCASRQSDASSDISKCTRDAGFASDSSINSEADGLRREVRKLHKRLSAQDKLLQSTVDRLQTANRLKEGIEHAILRQLTVTHDVLKKARGNLEAQAVDTNATDLSVPYT